MHLFSRILPHLSSFFPLHEEHDYILDLHRVDIWQRPGSLVANVLEAEDHCRLPDDVLYIEALKISEEA